MSEIVCSTISAIYRVVAPAYFLFRPPYLSPPFPISPVRRPHQLLELHEFAPASSATAAAQLLVPRIKRLQLHLDDYHWRVKILYGRTASGSSSGSAGAGAGIGLNALGTSLNDLAPTLLQRSTWDSSDELVGTDAQLGELQWQQTRAAWLRRREGGSTDARDEVCVERMLLPHRRAI